MTTHECRCGQPSPDAELCNRCTTRTQDALTDIARLLPELATTAAGQGATAQRTGRVGGTGHGDGVNVHALDVLAEVRGVVTGWLRVMVEETVITTMPHHLDNGFDDTAALCTHLATRMPLIRLHALAGDVAADILDTDTPTLALTLDGSTRRPPLAALVRQVVDTHRDRDESFTAAAGDRLQEALDSFVPVALAVRAVRELGHDVTEARARRWVSEGRLLVEQRRRSMDAAPEPCVMPRSLVELAGLVRRGRRPS